MWRQKSRAHVLGLWQDQRIVFSWCYPCLMHIHNGLKIAQTLCNQILPLFALIGISGTQIETCSMDYFCFLFCCSDTLYFCKEHSLFLHSIYLSICLSSFIHSFINSFIPYLIPLYVTTVQHVDSDSDSKTHVRPFMSLYVAACCFAELKSEHCASAGNQHERGDEWSL